jgi:hypothetical protein
VKRRETTIPTLISHRRLAERLDVDTETLRNWVQLGEFPEPVAMVSQTWFYRETDIAYWIANRGRWPDGTRFRGRDPIQSSPSPNS